MSQASRDELLATLREEAKTLRAENQALRGRLGGLLGEQRAAALDTQAPRQRHVHDTNPSTRAPSTTTAPDSRDPRNVLT